MNMIIKHFLEENWAEFLAFCQQRGIDSEDEVEREVDKALDD